MIWKGVSHQTVAIDFENEKKHVSIVHHEDCNKFSFASNDFILFCILKSEKRRIINDVS